MAVQFDRAMIDLVREIRRRVSAEEKPGIKLANPDMFSELLPIYRNSNDVILKTLIKELLERAGDDWLAKLSAPNEPENKSNYLVKVYRGQVQYQEKPTTETTEKNEKSKKMVYRGQVINN